MWKFKPGHDFPDGRRRRNLKIASVKVRTSSGRNAGRFDPVMLAVAVASASGE
jgi:hypothetical protein